MKIEADVETGSFWRVIKSTLKPKRKGALNKWPYEAISWDPDKYTPEVLSSHGLLFLVPREGTSKVPYYRDELRRHLERTHYHRNRA